MANDCAERDVRNLLAGFEERIRALSEAHEQAQRAVDFRERGDQRRALMCEDAARAALRRAIDIEQRTPRAANEEQSRHR
jgi:hypothetical protein